MNDESLMLCFFYSLLRISVRLIHFLMVHQVQLELNDPSDPLSQSVRGFIIISILELPLPIHNVEVIIELDAGLSRAFSVAFLFGAKPPNLNSFVEILRINDETDEYVSVYKTEVWKHNIC